VESELPRAREKGSLNGNAVAAFPTKPLRSGRPGNGSGTVFDKSLPLVFRDLVFREHLALMLRVNHKLAEKVFRVLIDAAKPIEVSDILNSGNAQHAFAIGKRQRLNDRGAIDDHQPISACQFHATTESRPDNRQETKEQQSDGKGTDGEHQTGLLAEQVGKH